MKLFISYRRKSWPSVQLLEENLGEQIEGSIFVDYKSIDDTDFERSIIHHLRESDIVLVVVTEDTFAPNRIHNEKDWVRREIALALEMKKPIIPILIDNYPLPSSSSLPENIRDIAKMQTIEFYPAYFDAAVLRLVAFITRVVPSTTESIEKRNDGSASKTVWNIPHRHNPFFICYWLWKVLEYFWKSILPVVSGLFVGILLLDKIQLSRNLVGILWNEWIIPHRFLAVSIIFGLIVLMVLCWVGSQKYVRYRPLPVTPTSEKLEVPVKGSIHSEDRSKSSMQLLEAMYKKWITDYLEKLKSPYPLELGLRDRPDLLPPSPLQDEYPGMKSLPSPLPLGTTIEQVYEQTIQGQLLIVGEAGSGKTTLFLHLAQYLFKRAQEDKTQPIPAIFKVSSWAKKRLPLTEWLIEELKTEYSDQGIIARDVVEALVRDGRLLLLLDDLDEVGIKNCAACVKAINTYLDTQLNKKKNAVPLVICCRSNVYGDLIPRLKVQRVIELLPPSHEQIEDYFRHTAPEPLWNTVRNDAQLYQLAHQPLMLSVLTQTYQESDQSQVPTGRTREEALRIIWDAYIHKVWNRDKRILRWKEEQGRHWLTVLAKQMQQQVEMKEFRVESLQVDLLRDPLRRLFPWCMGIVAGIIVGIIVGAIFGVLMAVIFSILLGVLAGVVVNNRKITPTERLGWKWKKFGICILAGIGSGVILGILGSVLLGGGLSSILGGVLGGVAFAVINGIDKAQVTHQEPHQEPLRPNAGIWQSGISGLLVGMLSGVAIALIIGTLGGVVFGVFSGMVFGILSGMEKTFRDDGGLGRQRPGITGTIVTMISGIAFGILGALVGWLFFGVIVVTKGIVGAVLDGVIFAIYFSILDGGDAFFLHYSLRLFLWCTNLLPLRLVDFLDEMDEHALLSRLGRGYIFIHPLLREHFARAERD